MGLSKKDARDIIEGGGSVLHKGKLITRVDQLYAFDGTPEEKDAEREALRRRLAELDSEGGGSGDEASDESAAGGASEDGSASDEKDAPKGAAKRGK